jgi:hypothetical protein
MTHRSFDNLAKCIARWRSWRSSSHWRPPPKRLTSLMRIAWRSMTGAISVSVGVWVIVDRAQLPLRSAVKCIAFAHFFSSAFHYSRLRGRSDGAAFGSRRTMLNHIAAAVEWSASSGGASFDMQRKVAVVRIEELTEGACVLCVHTVPSVTGEIFKTRVNSPHDIPYHDHQP